MPGRSHGFEHLVGVLEQSTGFAQQGLTHRREPDRMGLPLEQRGS